MARSRRSSRGFSEPGLWTGLMTGRIRTCGCGKLGRIRTENGAFPIVFAVVFGMLVWLGLVLREPRLVRMILQRQ